MDLGLVAVLNRSTLNHLDNAFSTGIDMLCEIILESSRIVYLYEKPQQVTKREM